MTGYNDAIGYDAMLLYNGVMPVPPVPSAVQSGGGNMLMRREIPIVAHDNRQRVAILEALDEEW
jgi:hypothetical protein